MQPPAFGGFGTHAAGTTIQSVVSGFHLQIETCTNGHGKTTSMIPLIFVDGEFSSPTWLSHQNPPMPMPIFLDNICAPPFRTGCKHLGRGSNKSVRGQMKGAGCGKLCSRLQTLRSFKWWVHIKRCLRKWCSSWKKVGTFLAVTPSCYLAARIAQSWVSCFLFQEVPTKWWTLSFLWHIRVLAVRRSLILSLPGLCYPPW